MSLLRKSALCRGFSSWFLFFFFVVARIKSTEAPVLVCLLASACHSNWEQSRGPSVPRVLPKDYQRVLAQVLARQCHPLQTCSRLVEGTSALAPLLQPLTPLEPPHLRPPPTPSLPANVSRKEPGSACQTSTPGPLSFQPVSFTGCSHARFTASACIFPCPPANFSGAVQRMQATQARASRRCHFFPWNSSARGFLTTARL